MKRIGRVFGGLAGVAAAGLLVLLTFASSATADSMAVQPDGKILLIGQVRPQAGALARLEPDGAVDPGFGQGGFVIDHRLPSLQALAVGADDRIVVAAVGGVRLARYLPDGTPDPTFAGGGVGGDEEPDQPVSAYPPFGPSTVVISTDGSVVVAENRLVAEGDSEVWIKRYDASGSPQEVVGHIGPVGSTSSSNVVDLLEEPDRSLVGAGSAYEPFSRHSALLAGFLPGSGGGYDTGFGGGAGLVRLDLPSPERSNAWFEALTRDGEKIVAAGGAEGGFLVARFAADGTPDQSLGDGGRVVPPIAGPSAGVEQASSWATGVATLGDGELAVAGGTSEWSEWSTGKLGLTSCAECPQPLLAVLDASGRLDPSFGSGGVVRLLRPDGSVLTGALEQVVGLSDGKILVEGTLVSGQVEAPFIARLNRDGSYDPTFGEGGLTVLRFPCTDQSQAERHRAGCVASLHAKIGLRGLRQRRPVLSLRVWPSLDWAALSDLMVTLPRQLRLSRDFRSKLSVRGAADDPRVHVIPPHDQKPYTSLAFSGLGTDRRLRVRLPRGALHLRGPTPRHRLTLKLRVHFSDARWGTLAGHDEVTRRVG